MQKMSVDDFVDLRVAPEFIPVVAMIRGLMKECAPQAKEIISFGLPAYQTQRIVAVISPNKKDITLSFSRDVQFEDRYGLLRGSGKSSRHVKIRSVAGANQEALRDYIRQALEADAR